MNLRRSWTGTVAYNFAFHNSSFVTSITKMEFSVPKYQANITVNFFLVFLINLDLTDKSKHKFTL